MSFSGDYYENFSGLSVEDYVDKFLLNDWKQTNRIKKTIDFFPHDVKNVLDIGAGFGILLKYLDECRGIKGVGIEITDSKILYAQNFGIDMRKGDASKLTFENKSFDLVNANEVLEHLPCGIFESALNEISRVAKKYIVISVPYREDRVFVQCPYCMSKVDSNYHIRGFSEKTLETLFLNAELVRLEKIGSIDTYPFVKKLKRSSIWPQFLVCPCCGYKNQSPAGDDTRIKQKNKFLIFSNKFFKRALFPMKKKKPQWIIGLYKIN